MNKEQFQLPTNLQEKFKKAKKLEWMTIVYLISVVILMYLVMGNSQAMKTAWLEDVLSMVPAISFLVASKNYDKKANRKFPYGYHKSYGIAFLCSALALFGMGCFLLIDSFISLVNLEHPTIGSGFIFGKQVWMGWIMILALLYSSIPAIIIGYKKLPLAKKLHNKNLYTDAEAQKADYTTAFAAILGIIGIGIGWWWADAVAALFISISVLKDGLTNLKTAVLDLLDRYPVNVGSNSPDKLVDEIKQLVVGWEWVKDAHVRFREDGQVYFGEVIIAVYSTDNIHDNIQDGLKELYRFHWKIHDVVIMPVEKLE